jgi:hypothetical protein
VSKNQSQGIDLRTQFLVAAASAAFFVFAGAASADPAAATTPDNAVVPQGVVGADYSYLGLNDHLGNANVYGAELGGVVPLEPNSPFSLQVTGAYHRVDSHDLGGNDWNVGGAFAWSQPWGRVGANLGYTNDSLAGVGGEITNYGVYGEYFADRFTVGARGGGATGSANAFGFSTGSQTGGYVGGEAIGYAMPDLAVRGTIGWVGIDQLHQFTAGVHGEYLFSQTTPISGWVGYDYADLGADGFSIHGNTFSVGLKYYFGGGGSLQHRQRTGVDDWGPSQIDINR